MLFVKQPYRAFVEVACKLFPDALRPSTLFEASGPVPGTFVHATARMEAGVRLDPGVVIGARAEIGAGTVIAAGAVIGPEVRIGRDCVGIMPPSPCPDRRPSSSIRVRHQPGQVRFVPGPGGAARCRSLGASSSGQR
jgi:hypothetical protein